MGKQPSIIIGRAADWLPLFLRWWRWFWPRPSLELKGDMLATHKRVIGTTGVGKTGLLVSLAWQLIQQGVGMSFIDPHGDAVEQILGLLIQYGHFKNPDTYKRILYIEFTNDESGHFLPFNVLNQPHIPPHDLVSSVVDAFYRVWPSLADGHAPYFADAMYRGMRVLVDNKMTLFNLDRVLRDKAFRDPLLPQVTDPDVLSYFYFLDSLKDERLREDRIVTAANRIELMKDPPVLKYSLGQQANVMDFNRFIDEPVILLLNLHPIRNDEARAMIGALLTKFFEEAALSRGFGRPRTQYHLIIDEMAEFVSKSGKSFTKMLSETRKYNFFATFAHQDLAQLKGDLAAAVQNVGVEISLRVGAEDTPLMARRLGLPIDPLLVKAEALADRQQPVFSSVLEQREVHYSTLADLKKRYAYVRVPPHEPVLVTTLDVPFPKVDPEEMERVKAEYRRQLMVPRSNIVLPHHQMMPQARTGTTTKRNSP